MALLRALFCDVFQTKMSAYAVDQAGANRRLAKFGHQYLKSAC
jgi:hypothetical protein